MGWSKHEANNYEREPNVSSAGYFRTGESANVNFNFTPKKVGRYLFLLTESGSNTILGYFAIYFTGETNAIRTVSIQQATVILLLFKEKKMSAGIGTLVPIQKLQLWKG